MGSGTWKRFQSLPLYIGSGAYKYPISPPLYGLWHLEKIRVISSMDMKHVFIAGTWTGVSATAQAIFGR